MTKEQKMLISAALANGDLEFKTFSDFEDETEEELNEILPMFTAFDCAYEAGQVLRAVDPIFFRQCVLERLDASGYVEDPARVWGDTALYIKKSDLDEFLTTHELLKSLKDTPAN